MSDPASLARRVFAEMQPLIAKTVDDRLREQTGVVPGGPYGSFSVDLYGRVTGAGAGGSAILVAVYDISSAGTSKGAGNFARVNCDSLIYDPGGVVTTGASWHFTPPLQAWYRFSFFSVVFPTAAFNAGEHLYAQLWESGSGLDIMSLLDEQFVVTEGSARASLLIYGARERECLTSESPHIRFGNGTAASVTLAGDNAESGATRIVIERLT